MPSKEDILRAALFAPCSSKEHLHDWINIYLGLDMPDTLICDDDIRNPPSNSSPMDLIWLIYSKLMSGGDPEYMQILGFSARGCYKTLSAAILEVLCVLHGHGNVAHMAALEVQAINCQEYVDKFLRRPILNEFLTSKNKRTVEVTKYISDSGIISPVQYEVLPPEEKGKYTVSVNTIKIVIATVDAANGLHAFLTIFDEVDLIPHEVLQEAKGVPEADKGRLPLTFYTSTRKYSFGEVQKEIDNADKTRMKIFHWNLIDVARRCSPSRHLPDEPKIKIFYSEDKLKAINEEQWSLLADKEKEQYDQKIGFKGCLSRCGLFSVCQGRLAEKQQSTSPLLKPIDQVQDAINRGSIEFTKAQYLCWKPSTEGLIYPNFSREIHLITAAEMANKITGEEFDAKFSKVELLNMMQEMKADFYAGMDHGYTHDFAVVTAALIGHILYVIDVISVRGFELQQRIDLCKERINHLKPKIYPDNAYPADNATFRRNGFKMINFDKDILRGIENARVRMRPGNNLPVSLFLLRGDEGCERLAADLLRYHWKVDTHGELVEQPDKDDDDRCDGFRYLCQNVPINKTGTISGIKTTQQGVYAKNNPNQDWMKRKIQELTGEGEDNLEEVKGKPGSINYIF
jgi:hypothetical protein